MPQLDTVPIASDCVVVPMSSVLLRCELVDSVPIGLYSVALVQSGFGVVGLVSDVVAPEGLKSGNVG